MIAVKRCLGNAKASIGDLFDMSLGGAADEKEVTNKYLDEEGLWDETFQQGGQVPTMSPNNLMRLLSSLQEQQGGINMGGLKKGGLGGSNSNNVPTISDFFGAQGKSLGGSNKQSLAEILGRR